MITVIIKYESNEFYIIIIVLLFYNNDIKEQK